MALSQSSYWDRFPFCSLSSIPLFYAVSALLEFGWCWGLPWASLVSMQTVICSCLALPCLAPVPPAPAT